MTSQLGHARAMEQQLWQCPQCPGGWQQYLVSEDLSRCPNCGYSGGPAMAGPGAIDLFIPVGGSNVVDITGFTKLHFSAAQLADASHLKVRISVLCKVSE
jgi:hypothetical protein